MCICNRNWQANDCSERVCQFGLAHVDTPKGDLDGSGSISGPQVPVVENSFNYPYGTSEQFPAMQDTDLNVLVDSAHYYMECSNKGTCDRSTGTCSCYDGYDGVACQRASCPNSCSGHGVCKTIKQLAAADHGNVYKLWDKDVTMGCQCDAGYFGPDCSQKQCKFGVDPLYLDDVSTIKYSTFDVAIMTTDTGGTATFYDGQNVQKQGYWALRFYDAHGEDWVTMPIVAGAPCTTVIAALEALPNNVIPKGQTYCTLSTTTPSAGEFEGDVRGIDAQHTGRDNYHKSPYNREYYIAYNISFWDADVSSLDPYSAIMTHTSSYETNTVKLFGYIYRLKFFGNPGALQQPQVEVYLDGKRPSLMSASNLAGAIAGETVITKVWTDGQQGEFNDYFADHCNGVTVNIGRASYGVGVSFLTGLTSSEKILLQTCLGSSDFDTSNNQGYQNWDLGSIYYPHIIKLVRTVTTYTDGGYYAVIYYDTGATYDNSGTAGTFKLLNPFTPPDGYLTDSYEVYTTTGTLALTSNFSEVTFSFGSNTMYMTNITADLWTDVQMIYDGDISCEVGNNNAFKMKYIFHCLNKGDMFTVLNWEMPQYNPPHINLYTAQRLMHSDILFSIGQRFNDQHTGLPLTSPMQFMTHSITTDLATNWAASPRGRVNTALEGAAMYRVYKFFPATVSTYNYVAQCSNRGICDNTAGTCNCFPGYTLDSCSEQASIAL